jgi:hypothetical protein
MTEKQILGFEPEPRIEHIGDEHSERVQDRKHHPEGCDDSALRCESRPDGVFGKDRGTQSFPQPYKVFARDAPLFYNAIFCAARQIRSSGDPMSAQRSPRHTDASFAPVAHPNVSSLECRQFDLRRLNQPSPDCDHRSGLRAVSRIPITAMNETIVTAMR